ncbi:MAG: sugar phosphate isomerase/epimerase [Candidatus Solibacter sp.]
MQREVTRREFSRLAGAGLGASLLAGRAALAAPARRLKIGHTGITWGYAPANAEQAIKDIAAQGYTGFESFGNVIESWEAKGGMLKLLDEAKVKLISAYCPVNLTVAEQRTAEIAKIVGWGKLIKKNGGSVAVIGPNNVRRNSYDFPAAKPAIVATLNEMCKALADVGITGVLHQHTGTCVEVRDEVYAVLDAVDTRYVKFGPDIGQLAKGGVDPVKVVKDYVSVIRHVHLKDFDGGPNWTGYCPLGRGKVDTAAIMDLLETQKDLAIAMVELDPDNPPMPAIQTAQISKEYLQKQGYVFRS